MGDSFSKPCSGYGGKPGCGRIIYFTKDDETGKWNKPTNQDGSLHQCSSNRSEKRSNMSGFEQAQANSNTERILNTVIPKMVELQEQTCNKVHDEVETVTSIFNKMNNDYISFVRSLDGNIKDIKHGLNIKGKTDYTKEDKVETLEDTINTVKKDLGTLLSTYSEFRDEIKADLMKNAFVPASKIPKGDQTKIE